jgi:hypothetical protein
MSTILASTSQADSATTTTSTFAFDTAQVIKTMCVTPSIGPPSQQCQVSLYLSADNITFHEVDTRWFAYAGTFFQSFVLSEYSQLPSNFGVTAPWAYYYLKFFGNVGAAVTISADVTGSNTVHAFPLTATTATTGGAAGAWQPPGGEACIIRNVVILVVTGSTGAANVNAGIAANATTSNSSLIAASSVHTSGSVIDSNTTSTVAQYMAAGDFITFTASATLAGMVATAYIDYILP